MTTLLRSVNIGMGLFGVLVLSACSSGPKSIAPASAIQHVDPDEVEEIAALLDRGEVRSAEKRLRKGLDRDPMNPSLQVLLQGIEGDARTDLGPKNFSYTVRSGETMTELAERFLGNRLKSYQLAKYNGIDVPDALEVGRELLIPGQSPNAASTPRSTPKAEKAAPARPKTEVAKPAKPAAAPAPRKTVDHAAARRARSAGLVALNQGNVKQAVALLRRAAALDPDNKAIAADLRRAEQIAATVRARQ